MNQFPFKVVDLTHTLSTSTSSKLPAIGSFSLALPILTEGGTEAPIRLIGLLHHIDE